MALLGSCSTDGLVRFCADTPSISLWSVTQLRKRECCQSIIVMTVAVCCRLNAHKHVLESATAVLLKRIQSMQTEGLLKLLADTFIYVSLPIMLT